MKIIVIITSGQPSTNPRAVKEAVSFYESGFQVIFIYNFWVKWASKTDVEIKELYPFIKFICVGGDPEVNKTFYLFTRLRHKIFRIMAARFPEIIYLQERAESRCFFELKKCSKKNKAAIYLAHNLAALPAAAYAAKVNKAYFAFDAEDFHRGQVDDRSIQYQRTKFLEDTFLPSAKYITAASPLIAKEYQALYATKVVCINNVFSRRHSNTHPKKVTAPIGLFWFSQNIGLNRGIEDIVKALHLLPITAFKLTLLGDCDSKMKDHFLQLAGANGETRVDVVFMDTVHPDDIFKIAAQADIGLALEPGRDINNQIALSNKIFTYLIAGNAVIFSETRAQKLFYKENPEVGCLYPCGNSVALAAKLKRYLDDPVLLETHKKNAAALAATMYNFEEEKKKLLSTIQSVLGGK